MSLPPSPFLFPLLFASQQLFHAFLINFGFHSLRVGRNPCIYPINSSKSYFSKSVKTSRIFQRIFQRAADYAANNVRQLFTQQLQPWILLLCITQEIVASFVIHSFGLFYRNYFIKLVVERDKQKQPNSISGTGAKNSSWHCKLLCSVNYSAGMSKLKETGPLRLFWGPCAIFLRSLL